MHMPISQSEPSESSFAARRRPGVSVVLSFFNEEEVLPELISRLRAVLGQQQLAGFIAGYELIFVNDASTDRSLNILLTEAARAPDIRILNMSRNFGVSPCVLAGMAHACGDVIIYMDADLQDPPEVIPELIRAWREDPSVEVVHTVRRSRAGESRVKLWLTHWGYRILRQASSVDIRMNAGDFKLLSSRAARHLLLLGEKKPFLRGLVSWIGFPQAEVHYDRAARFAGRTKFLVCGPKVIRNFFESALISFSDAPLRLGTYAGLGSSLAAFVLLAHVMFEKLAGHNIPGWTAIMSAVLFVGGIQMFLLGVAGLYIGSIYQEVKRRPNYIIASSYGLRQPAGYELLGPSTDPAHRRVARPHVLESAGGVEFSSRDVSSQAPTQL